MDLRFTEEQQLLGIATGQSIVTIAWHEPEGGPGPDGIRARAEGDRITGTKILVPYASSATTILTLARTDRGIGLFEVDPANVEMQKTPSMAADPQYQVELSNTPATPIADDGWSKFEHAMSDGLIALAASAVGGAERAHEM